jgi:hypothetical protein
VHSGTSSTDGPPRSKGPALNARANEIAIETLEIATRVSSSWPEACPRRRESDVIVDFVFEEGVLYARREHRRAAALKVRAGSSRDSSGSGAPWRSRGSRSSAIIEYLAPRKEIRTLVDSTRRLLRAQGADRSSDGGHILGTRSAARPRRRSRTISASTGPRLRRPPIRRAQTSPTERAALAVGGLRPRFSCAHVRPEEERPWNMDPRPTTSSARACSARASAAVSRRCAEPPRRRPRPSASPAWARRAAASRSPRGRGRPRGCDGRRGRRLGRSPAGFTYLGQFIDHDLTFDKTNVMLGEHVRPTALLQAARRASTSTRSTARARQIPGRQFYEADGST